MTPLRVLQMKESEILKQVIAFMDDNGLAYVALGGTLLGAVRHKGFIPWDDDIDIGLPREDYEKFLEIGQKRFCGENNLYLQNFKFDKEYKYYFSRVVDKNFTVKDRSATVEKTQYAWIDIFPLDGMPKGKLARKIHKFRLLSARLMFQYSQFSTMVSVNLPNRPFHERLLIKIGKILPVEKMFSTEKALKRLDRRLKKYPYASSPYAVNFMGAGKFKEMHKREIYDVRAKYPFEDMVIYSVADYDTWLKQMYGDYMTPPPDSEKNKHFTEAEGNDE